MPNPKLQRTRNYSQFVFTKENRDVNTHHPRPEHKRLLESMKKYGWLPSSPAMVQAVNGHLVVKEGQHRIAFAKQLGLDVWYVVDDTDICISEINATQAGWTIKDYTKRWMNEGIDDYLYVSDFAEQYQIPLGLAFAINAGSNHLQTSTKQRFMNGEYRIRTKELALKVATFYQALVTINPKIKNSALIRAIWACMHVRYFEPNKVINTANNRSEMLVPTGRCDAALEMLEEIYNFGRRVKVPLKFDAEQALREKNPTGGK